MFNIPTLGKISQVKPEITGFLVFDIIVGGLAQNRINHIFAPDGVGKTTLSLYLLSNCIYRVLIENKLKEEIVNDMKPNDTIDLTSLDERYLFLRFQFGKDIVKVAEIKDSIKQPYFVYVDCEQSFEPTWMSKLFKPINVDFKEAQNALLIYDIDSGIEIGAIVQPIYYEDIDKIFTTFEKYCITENKKGYLLWDSVVSPITKEFEKGKDAIGYRASAIQRLLDVHDKVLTECNITSIFVNQIREKIAMSLFSQPVSGETINIEANVPGGWALKFRSCLSFCLLKGKQISYGGNVEEKKNPYLLIGKNVKIHVGKNRLRAGGTKGEISFINDFGYSNIISIIMNFYDKIGTVESDLTQSDKGMRFTNYMSNLESDPSYIDILFDRAIKKLSLKFINNKIDMMNAYDWFYKDLFINECRRINQFAREYAGKGLYDETNEVSDI